MNVENLDISQKIARYEHFMKKRSNRSKKTQFERFFMKFWSNQVRQKKYQEWKSQVEANGDEGAQFSDRWNGWSSQNRPHPHKSFA